MATSGFGIQSQLRARADCARTIRFVREDLDRLDELARLTRQSTMQVIRNLIRSAELTGQYPVKGSCLPPAKEEKRGE